METYININTLVDNEVSKAFRSLVICPLCKNIYIKPIMCNKCQQVYCQKCIDKWSDENRECPNNCEDPTYQNCIFKNEILSKLKFICVGCEQEIYYDEGKNHHKECCPDKTSEDMKKKKPKIQRLQPEEVEKYTNEGNEIEYITCKLL